MVYSKQLMLTLPTVHCILPFCIVPCLVYLVGSAVVKYDFVLVPDDVCDVRVRKIFVHEASEISSESGTNIKAYKAVIR